MLPRVAVVAAPGAIGHLIASRARARPAFGEVMETSPDDPELASKLSACESVVSVEPQADAVGAVLGAAAGRRRLVHISSVTVYGARADAGLPLTEDRPLQPVHGYPPAVEQAEAERRLRVAQRHHPELTVTVLRAAVGAHDPLFRHLARGRVRVKAPGPPRQFLHPDDLAEAVLWAAAADHPGVFNLAPEGSMDDADVARLAGRRRTVSLPFDAASRLLRRLDRLGLTGLPPGALAYLAYPVVVDPGRLVEAGFRCEHSSEVALRAGLADLPVARVPPAVPVAAAGLAGLGVAAYLWSRSRKRS